MKMKDVPVILDLGHYALKGIVGDDESRRTLQQHALIELSREEWVNVVETGRRSHPDYIQVGNRYYEVGDTAAKHTFTPAEGVSRYLRTYYGVLMCHVIAMLFEPSEIKSAIVFASYPPGDRRHKDELEKSLLGKWMFSHMGRSYDIVVRHVATYTEPQGGFWNFLIQSEDGGHYDNPDYNPKRDTLVIDFGGGTLSMLPIGKNQLPDFRRAESLPIGFNDVARWFTRELRANHRELFRYSRKIAPEQLHEALRTGRFVGGGNEEGEDVHSEVDESLSELIEEFRMAYQRVGGPVPYGQIILTGGGSAVLGDRLGAMLEHKRVFYAANDLDSMPFANVMGGLKAYREMFTESV